MNEIFSCKTYFHFNYFKKEKNEKSFTVSYHLRLLHGLFVLFLFVVMSWLLGWCDVINPADFKSECID